MPMASLFVKPAPNKEKPGTQLHVRGPGPSYTVLPKEGGEVPDNHFWRRRLIQGDVVLASAPAAPEKF
jgi:hypothetical protein